MNQPSNEAMTLKVIAHIHTAFPTKFGIPRQSGLVDSLRGEIVFTPEYRSPDAVRGLVVDGGAVHQVGSPHDEHRADLRPNLNGFQFHAGQPQRVGPERRPGGEDARP